MVLFWLMFHCKLETAVQLLWNRFLFAWTKMMHHAPFTILMIHFQENEQWVLVTIANETSAFFHQGDFKNRLLNSDDCVI